jgi:hypothetical protein
MSQQDLLILNGKSLEVAGSLPDCVIQAGNPALATEEKPLFTDGK